jgi:hypothetical protein
MKTTSKKKMGLAQLSKISVFLSLAMFYLLIGKREYWHSSAPASYGNTQGQTLRRPFFWFG